MDRIYLDKEGYNNYLRELDEIREKIRKNSSDISEYASDDAYGDGWHDNFAYESAIQKENALLYQYHQKLEGLNKIEIIENTGKKDRVEIGSIVEIQFDNESNTELYKITGNTVSGSEDDIICITINSPLGKSIYKKKKEDSFSYEIDSSIISGKIIEIK